MYDAAKAVIKPRQISEYVSGGGGSGPDLSGYDAGLLWTAGRLHGFVPGQLSFEDGTAPDGYESGI